MILNSVIANGTAWLLFAIFVFVVSVEQVENTTGCVVLHTRPDAKGSFEGTRVVVRTTTGDGLVGVFFFSESRVPHQVGVVYECHEAGGRPVKMDGEYAQSDRVNLGAFGAAMFVIILMGTLAGTAAVATATRDGTRHRPRLLWWATLALTVLVCACMGVGFGLIIGGLVNDVVRGEVVHTESAPDPAYTDVFVSADRVAVARLRLPADRAAHYYPLWARLDCDASIANKYIYVAGVDHNMLPATFKVPISVWGAAAVGLGFVLCFLVQDLRHLRAAQAPHDVACACEACLARDTLLETGVTAPAAPAPARGPPAEFDHPQYEAMVAAVHTRVMADVIAALRDGVVEGLGSAGGGKRQAYDSSQQ